MPAKVERPQPSAARATSARSFWARRVVKTDCTGAPGAQTDFRRRRRLSRSSVNHTLQWPGSAERITTAGERDVNDSGAGELALGLERSCAIGLTHQIGRLVFAGVAV